MNRALIDRELRDEPDARAECLTDLEGWRDQLIAVIQHVESQFSARAANASSFRTECFARGADGKADWFRWEADYLEWRRSAAGYKRHVIERLREVKALIKATNRNGNDWRMETWAEVRAAVDAWEEGADTDASMRRIAAAFRRYDDQVDAR